MVQIEAIYTVVAKEQSRSVYRISDFAGLIVSWSSPIGSPNFGADQWLPCWPVTASSVVLVSILSSGTTLSSLETVGIWPLGR